MPAWRCHDSSNSSVIHLERYVASEVVEVVLCNLETAYLPLPTNRWLQDTCGTASRANAHADDCSKIRACVVMRLYLT